MSEAKSYDYIADKVKAYEKSLRELSARLGADNFNAWPKLDIVRTQRYDLNDAKQAFEAGKLMVGDDMLYRQCTDIPTLEPHYNHQPTFFMWAREKGQRDTLRGRNILAVYEHQKYDSVYGPPHHIVVVLELGCAHDYDDAGSNHIRGYHVGKCRKCGHQYTCDSGD